MRMTRNFGFILIVIICNWGTLHAQNTVLVSGGSMAGDEGSISYSVGQTVYTTEQGSSGELIQGIQQPYEITVDSGLESMETHISVYPNPAGDMLHVNVEGMGLEGLRCELYSVQGSLLGEQAIRSADTRIGTEKLVPSVYLLRVYRQHQEVITFKIIKR